MTNVLAKPGMPLTKREWQVCQLVAQGMSNKEVARQLQIGPRTVEDHRLAAYAKYGVHNIMELLQRLTAEGLPCPCCGRAK